jgi:multicomponent Na+:H+ antiporter subunit G
MIFFQLLAIFVILLGTLFSMLGVLGFWRFPDVYTRLHTTGKVGVFGVVLLLLGTALAIPAAASRAFVLVAMLLLVGPVTAHALASAAHRLGIPMQNAQRNDLATHQRDYEQDG